MSSSEGQVEIYSPDLILVDGQDVASAGADLRLALAASEWPVIILGPDGDATDPGWPPGASVLAAPGKHSPAPGCNPCR